MTDTAASPRVQPRSALLARADLLLVLIDLLRSPVAGEWPREPMPSSASLAELVAAADLGPAPELSVTLEDAVAEAQRVSRDALSDEHHRLFEGAMPCPLNETAYVRRDKGAIIGDLAGFYRAFGFAPGMKTGEKADHLLTELEFVVALLVMCAQAEADEPRDIAIDALGKFVVAHPADWVPAVCERLGQMSVLPLFQQTSAALDRFWERLILVHDFPVTPATATEPVPNDEPESPYECGATPTEELVPLRAGGREV
jgi:putative dimethyl sulfoxide reductase chaperone